MAKILRIKELEERKRLLVAESEVYRQTLMLEVQNLRLYSVRLQKKLTVLRLANPLFLLAGSVLGSRLGRRGLIRRRRGQWSRIFGGLLLGWRLFRKFRPVLQSGLLERLLRKRGTTRSTEEQAPAANI